MRVFHIYNPDTDYALAFRGTIYSPPASIVRLRKEGALLPALYARKGDVILLLDELSQRELETSPYYPCLLKKKIGVVSVSKGFENVIPDVIPSPGSVEVLPWGWNLSLRNYLLRKDMPESWLKSEYEIERIRILSHRRTTIPFRQELSLLLPFLEVKTAKEFFSEEEAWAFASENPSSYFKMPWSSAGRGVVCRKNMTDLKFGEWIHGAIIRQGSVLGEYGYDRVIDFATEWICRNGDVRFMGLSFFNTSSNGTYIGNYSLSQKEIYNTIKSHSPFWNEDIIEAQRNALRKIIAPYYEGPLGIDMLVDKNGMINPCVEINLRMTMGMATILANS